MPLIRVDLMEGRDPLSVETLMSSITEAVQTALGVPQDKIHVIVDEIASGRWAIGGIPVSTGAGPNSKSANRTSGA
ncbi:MAG TPA: tautomerase family protein [Acidimicrobiia bacterium]|nr:tautomerase family protein [Acidimicrobiia bacterium]